MFKSRTRAPNACGDRRGDAGFERKVYKGMSEVVPLPHLGIELPRSEIYKGFDETEPEE
jgi:hypothetical protein